MKPDFYAALALPHAVQAFIVEAAASTPSRELLRRLTPRMLAYKAYADTCLGPRSLLLYVSLTPPSSQQGYWEAAAVTVEDPLKAARLLHSRLEQLLELAEATAPPQPGTPKPPCRECGYRTICPHARS